MDAVAPEAATADNFEQVKAQLQFDNARLENEVHRLNRQIGQLKSSLEGAQSETKTVSDELKTTKTQLDEVSSNLQAQTAQVSAHVVQESQLREQVSQLREEKRELLTQIAERRNQLDEKSVEINRLNELVQDMRQQRAADQEELARLRSQTSVSDVSEHILKQSLDLAKNQVKWLDEELVKTQTEMQRAKSELARTSTTGRAEVGRLRAEIESFGEQTEELRQRNSQLERTLRAKLETERMTKEQLAEQTEQFKREMAAQKKLCVEWEKTTEAAKQNVRSVEESLRNLESHQRENEAKAQEAVELMEQRVEEVEQEYSQLQEKAAEMASELENANQLLNEATRSQAMLLSPTAGVASKLQQQQGSQGRLNITQLYSEKIALEDKLRGAEAEIECLRESMEQILSEIEERGPIIAAEREEYQRLLEDADQIAQDLTSVRQENAAKDQSLRKSKQENDLLQRQLVSEQQQTRDLSRQVARLLRAVEETRMGGRTMPERREETLAVVPEQGDEQLSEVDRVITQNLVAFSDITELVSQNRRLLRTTRELAAQVAQEEEQRRKETEIEMKGALEQAETMLDQLSIELDGTKTRMSVLERERDMLKSMRGRSSDDKAEEDAEQNLASSPPPPPVETEASLSALPVARRAVDTTSSSDTSKPDVVVRLQSDFDLYVSESRKTRAQLETDATKLQTEVSELRVRAAKGEAQNQFDVERIQMLTRDLETRQGEINHLRSSTSRLHKQIEACEKQMESMGQEMTSERAELSRLRRQSTLMEAECENLRSNDQRWRAEEQRLVAERTSLTQILENTTKMREEWQRASEAQVEQVRERLEANRQETDAVRQELKQARDSSERAQYKFDSELCELRSQIQQREERISQLQDQILAGKELQAKIQGERHEIELSRDDLQRQVATLEERIEGQELLMERAQSQGHTVSKEALLTVQLQDARTQLETLKSELETTQRRSEDYRQLATTNDISLKELSETYDQYKSQNDRTTAEQSARIAELDASLQASNAALNQCRSDLSSVTKRLQKMQAEMGEQKDNYAARLAKLDEENQFKARSLSALRDELERRDEAAQSMQVQYEKEVVMHAEVIKSSLLTRERLIETQRRLADIGGQLQASRDSNNQLQAQLNQARDKAADEIKSTRGQLADTRRQNSLLLAHLESLGHEVPDISVDPEKVAASAETDTAGGTGDTAAGTGTSSQTGLRDVVVYLRRERDLATAQLELAQQESQRLQQQCTYTQRMLDEVRNELLQYTPTGDADPLSNDNGSLRSESSADIIMKGNGPITLTATQRQSCQKQIKEILILRDSNSVLRSDMESTKRRLRDTERDLSHFRDQEVPRLQKDNGSLRAELQSVRTQVTQLTGMCEQWKQRHENMLAKYSMIEPEVYEALKVENQELKTRFERLEAENKQLQQRIAQAAEQQLSTDARKMTLLQSEIARLKKQIESQLLQLASEKDHARIQDSQIDSLREAVKAKESAIQTSNKEVADSQVKFEKLRDVFQRLRQQSVEKLEQSNMVIKGHESTIQVLTEQINASQRQQQPAASTGPEADAETLRRLEGEISALTKEKDEALAGYQNLAGELQETRAALQAARAQLLEKSQAQTQAQTQPQTQEEGVSSDNTTASAAEINRLKSELAAAEAKVNEYKGQLEELKVRASKYFSDNRVLQAKASALEKRLSEASTTLAPSTELQQQLEQTQKQLGEAQKQLAESDAKIEQAQATAKKMAELRSRLQISRETKRADDLAKQVDELQTKIGVLESGTGSLKRPMETDDGPSKKAHTEESS